MLTLRFLNLKEDLKTVQHQEQASEITLAHIISTSPEEKQFNQASLTFEYIAAPTRSPDTQHRLQRGIRPARYLHQPVLARHPDAHADGSALENCSHRMVRGRPSSCQPWATARGHMQTRSRRPPAPPRARLYHCCCAREPLRSNVPLSVRHSSRHSSLASWELGLCLCPDPTLAEAASH